MDSLNTFEYEWRSRVRARLWFAGHGVPEYLGRMLGSRLLLCLLWLLCWGVVLGDQGETLGWFAAMLVALDVLLAQAQANLAQAKAHRVNVAALLTLVRSGGGPSDQLEACYAEQDVLCALRRAEDIFITAQAAGGNARIGKPLPEGQGEVMTKALPSNAVRVLIT